MKSILFFEVKVELSDDLPLDRAHDVAQNIRDAIHHQVNTAGLTPEDTECFTTSFTVKGLNNSANLFTDLMTRPYEQPTIDKP